MENLLSYADRILSGNISTFVPVMCSEGIYTKLESAVVTSAIINKIVNRVEKIDYSIFYRERMVAYEEVGLNRFTVTGALHAGIYHIPGIWAQRFDVAGY
ncbi:MAG: hypothetical protein ACLTJ5_08350 [Clostridium sp.]